jgi:hypothetical protein
MPLTPKDVALWSSIGLAFATGLSAHFSVAADAKDAGREAAHVQELLAGHLVDAKERDTLLKRDIDGVRTDTAMGFAQVRAQADVTRERVIVLEGMQRQTLEAVARMEKTLERSTLLVPTGRASR